MLTRIKLWLAGAGVFVVALLSIWFGGKKAGQTDAKLEEQDDYIETRKRMDQAIRDKQLRDDADLDREWLRSRGE
jgi:hypothetical protein